MREIWNVFLVATKLGLTSFGGPVAHLGYFYEEYVRRRRWLDERRYADLTALCQFLPGPASSQVGIGIGMMRAGFAGGVAAWLGFTWPSFLLMAGFAFGLDRWAEAFGVASGAGWSGGARVVLADRGVAGRRDRGRRSRRGAVVRPDDPHGGVVGRRSAGRAA